MTIRTGKHLSRRYRKRIWKILGVALLLGLIMFVFVVRPGLKLAADAKEGVVLVKNLKQAAAGQNLIKMSAGVDSLDQLLQKTNSDFSGLGYIKFIPIARNYYLDGQQFLKAGNHALKSVSIILSALWPFRDVLGMGSPTVQKVTGEEKLAQIVQVAPQIVPDLERAALEIEDFRKEIDKINPNRYPKQLRGIKIRENLVTLKDSLNGAQEILKNSKPILAALPKALGAIKPQTYLILFQNDKELRPTGGFLTAYALIRFNAGKMKVIKSGDIHELDGDRSYLPGPPTLLRVLQLPHWYLRDTNFSPDFRKSMQDFTLYYNKNGNPKIDGIVALDTAFVESLLEISGPIRITEYTDNFSGFANLPKSCQVGGSAFTAKNVVCRLELYSERLLAKSSQRKALLGDLMSHLIGWTFDAPPQKWYGLVKTTLGQAAEKHVLLYLQDPTLQKLVEDYNFSGSVKKFDGDYLYINDANLAGQKSDLYMKRVIEQAINIDSNGKVTKKITLTYSNVGPWDGWLNTYNRDYVRILVPQGSKLLNSSGGVQKTGVTKDLGKTVFDNFLITAPGAVSTFTVEYGLPFNVKKPKAFKRSRYNLLIQKQPGKPSEKYILNVDGKTQEFDLKTDRELNLPL